MTGIVNVLIGVPGPSLFRALRLRFREKNRSCGIFICFIYFLKIRALENIVGFVYVFVLFINMNVSLYRVECFLYAGPRSATRGPSPGSSAGEVNLVERACVVRGCTTAGQNVQHVCRCNQARGRVTISAG